MDSYFGKAKNWEEMQVGGTNISSGFVDLSAISESWSIWSEARNLASTLLWNCGYTQTGEFHMMSRLIFNLYIFQSMNESKENGLPKTILQYDKLKV